MRDPSHEPDLRILSNLEWFEKRALVLVAAVAGGTLALWLLPPVAAFAPAGWSWMTATTAVGILLATGSLTLSAPRRSAFALRASTIMALALMALGIIVLLAHSGIVPFEIDNWPRRPAPHTALCFVLLGTCLALARQANNRLSIPADISAIALAFFVLFLFGGYAFQVMEFVGVDAANVTSPQALFCFFLLAFVIAARRATEGVLLAFLVNTGIGSQIARMVLPGIVAAPFLLFTLIEYLNQSGILPTLQTRAIAAPLVALVALAIVVWMGQRTNELERQLRLQSLTDQLTSVLNRRGFDAVAEYFMRNAQRTQTGLIAFYFDLDGLKQANDDSGHDVGSLMIKRFAELLVASFRDSDVVARIGGDEFVVLTAGASDSGPDVLARLEGNVANSNASGSLPQRIVYSAGYAELPPGGAGKIEALIAKADAMMYEHKSGKKAA